MKFKRPCTRSIAILLLVALISAACSGDESGSAPTTPDGDPPATTVETIATTGPIPTVSASDEVAVAPEVLDPHMVTVLEVNDQVQLVPTFDAPRGTEIKLYDFNAIENVETEYPLLASTVFGNRLALLVDEFDESRNWAKVFVPIRPNGTTAWVQTAFFTEKTHNYHIDISLSDNLVQVFKGDELLVQQVSVTGRPSRPTPIVRSYIDEKIPGPDLGASFGSWVLSIAAFSETLPTFGEGKGLPKLALHGTNQPDLMSQYVSSGCIRVPNDIIEFIAEHVPIGTIVNIIA